MNEQLPITSQTIQVKDTQGRLITVRNSGLRHDTLYKTLTNGTVRDALFTVFKDPQNNSSTSEVDLRLTTHTYPENPKANLDVLSHGDKRVYLDRNGEVVYDSEKNREAHFTGLTDFLDSPKGKHVEFALDVPVADVALFGTINKNLKTGESEAKAPDWMGQVEEAIMHELPGVRVFNPDKGSGVQTKAGGIDMHQLAAESKQLFEAPVIVMNFEPKGGGISLAELRMAMLASVLTGHKLIVHIEASDGTVDLERSRAVAQADIEFFKENFGDRLNMEFHGMEEALPLDVFQQKIIAVVRENQGKKEHKIHLPRHIHGLQKKIVLSGSSGSARDMAMRLELEEQMKQTGGEVVSTYNSDFDGNPPSREHMIASRKKELGAMLSATDHIVYAGDSLSPFGQVTTALLMAAYNGSTLRGLILNPKMFDIQKNDVRDSYGMSTQRSHTAKIVMSYQLAKVMELINFAKGKAPDLQRNIRVITDAIDPIVKSFGKKKLKDRLPISRFVTLITKWRRKESQNQSQHHENFHKRREEGFYPDRIVQDTPRKLALDKLIQDAVNESLGDNERVIKRLSDLLVYNAYANIFPPANSAADMFGVIDEKRYGGQYKDCIVLIKRARGEMLAPVGGFLDMGEGPAQGGKREAQEESRAKLGRGVPIAVLSDPSRDNRFAVISSVFANILDMDPANLKHGDDAAEVVVVKLKNDDGSLNDSYFTSGEVIDVVTGEKIKHKGMFAGHDNTIRQLYTFSKARKEVGQTLSEQVNALATHYPQEWFEGKKAHHEGTDNYSQLTVEGKGDILLTPNIKFVLRQTERIFRQAGMSRKDAKRKANDFVFNAVNHPQFGELLPKFPQPAVTVDNIVLYGDNHDMILVEKLENGEFRLPGGFYSKEQTDKGESTEKTARQVVKTKYQTDFTNIDYLGPVGGTVATGRQADSRYPRISHVYIGEAGKDFAAKAAVEGREGGTIVPIRLLNTDGTDLSDELLHAQWGFNHGQEILRPFLPAIKYQIAQRQAA